MTDMSDIKARLQAMDEKINAQRAKLELHGIFDRDHKITDKEIRDRWSKLQAEIDAQTRSPQALNEDTNALERQVHKWMDSIDLDYKS